MEDRWNMTEVLALLEGGNGRFREFCAVTNSFPLEVDNHKEFIDRLYATVPVKAYRSLLRKSVGKVLEEHKGLIHNHQAHLKRKKSLHHKRRHHDDTVCTMRKEDYKKYGKVLPMMSIYDYYTTVLKRDWPLTEEQTIDQLEDSALDDLEASASELMALQQDERPAEIDGKQHDNDEKQAIEGGGEARNHQIEKSLKVEEEKKDVDGNDDDDRFTNPNDSDPSVFSGDDPSLFGEALVSLAGDEGSVRSSVPSEPKQEEYTVALNDDEHESSSKPAAANLLKKRRQVRPEGASLQSVPESSPTNVDPDNDVVSVLSREEIELSSNKRFNPLNSRRNRVSNDDNQSVASSVGSSVGDMDLKSLPDAQSVVSSDLESISEVTKEDAIAKNLEPTLTTQNSFRNLSAEPVDTSYAPNEPGVESARNIHELEASNSKLEYDEDEMPPGESPEGGSRSGGRDDRDSDKSVQFGGLPSAPPERTKGSFRGLMKHVQEDGEGDSEEAGDGLLEGFQPRRNSTERKQEDSEPPSQERRPRRFPQPFNGRMGPKVVSNPNYAPPIRPSFRRGLLGGNKVGGEEKQMPRRMPQRSPSPQRAPSPQQQLASAASKVSSAYRHQVQSLARNFGRQPSRNESPQRNAIPEYSGNLAALGKVDDLSPTRVRSPSPTTHHHHQDGRNKLGSLIANSRRKLVNNTDKLSSSFRRGSVTNDL